MRLAHDEIKNLGSIKIQCPIAVSLGLKDMTKPKTCPKFIFKIDGFKTKHVLIKLIHHLMSVA